MVDLENIVAELREQLAKINKSIQVLAQFAAGTGPQKARTPKRMAEITAIDAPKLRGIPAARGRKRAAGKRA
jgi:hypothetical protein